MKKEKGIALPIVLFVLMGILLASSILIRSTDVSVSVAGNIGDRNKVGNSNETALAIASKWVLDNKAFLKNDNIAQGYNSSTPLIGIDYTDDDNWSLAKVLPTDSIGNTSSYMIYRMCSIPNIEYNESSGGIQNSCATGAGDAGTGATSSLGYDSYNFSVSFKNVLVFYKIVVKTEGSRGTKIITETITKL